MAKELKCITITRPHQEADTYTASNDGEVFRFIGNMIVGYASSYDTSNITFMHLLQEGETISIGNASHDEKLTNAIDKMDEKELEQVRNFCLSSGLLKEGEF